MNNLKTLFYITILVVMAYFVISCTSPQPRQVIERVPYSAVEAAPYLTQGTATLTGKAYAIDVEGNKHYASGSRAVWLIPKTSMSDQWYDVMYLKRQDLTRANDKVYDLVRYTRPMSKGEFKFSNLPNGKYYLVAYIGWGVTVLANSDIPYRQHGGVLVSVVYINGGTFVNISNVGDKK